MQSSSDFQSSSSAAATATATATAASIGQQQASVTTTAALNSESPLSVTAVPFSSSTAAVQPMSATLPVITLEQHQQQLGLSTPSPSSAASASSSTRKHQILHQRSFSDRPLLKLKDFFRGRFRKVDDSQQQYQQHSHSQFQSQQQQQQQQNQNQQLDSPIASSLTASYSTTVANPAVDGFQQQQSRGRMTVMIDPGDVTLSTRELNLRATSTYLAATSSNIGNLATTTATTATAAIQSGNTANTTGNDSAKNMSPPGAAVNRGSVSVTHSPVTAERPHAFLSPHQQQQQQQQQSISSPRMLRQGSMPNASMYQPVPESFPSPIKPSVSSATADSISMAESTAATESQADSQQQQQQPVLRKRASRLSTMLSLGIRRVFSSPNLRNAKSNGGGNGGGGSSDGMTESSNGSGSAATSPASRPLDAAAQMQLEAERNLHFMPQLPVHFAGVAGALASDIKSNLVSQPNRTSLLVTLANGLVAESPAVAADMDSSSITDVAMVANNGIGGDTRAGLGIGGGNLHSKGHIRSKSLPHNVTMSDVSSMVSVSPPPSSVTVPANTTALVVDTPASIQGVLSSESVQSPTDVSSSNISGGPSYLSRIVSPPIRAYSDFFTEVYSSVSSTTADLLAAEMNATNDLADSLICSTNLNGSRVDLRIDKPSGSLSPGRSPRMNTGTGSTHSPLSKEKAKTPIPPARPDVASLSSPSPASAGELPNVIKRQRSSGNVPAQPSASIVSDHASLKAAASTSSASASSVQPPALAVSMSVSNSGSSVDSSISNGSMVTSPPSVAMNAPARPMAGSLVQAVSSASSAQQQQQQQYRSETTTNTATDINTNSIVNAFCEPSANGGGASSGRRRSLSDAGPALNFHIDQLPHFSTMASGIDSISTPISTAATATANDIAPRFSSKPPQLTLPDKIVSSSNHVRTESTDSAISMGDIACRREDVIHMSPLDDTHQSRTLPFTAPLPQLNGSISNNSNASSANGGRGSPSSHSATVAHSAMSTPPSTPPEQDQEQDQNSGALAAAEDTSSAMDVDDHSQASAISQPQRQQQQHLQPHASIGSKRQGSLDSEGSDNGVVGIGGSYNRRGSASSLIAEKKSRRESVAMMGYSDQSCDLDSVINSTLDSSNNGVINMQPQIQPQVYIPSITSDMDIDTNDGLDAIPRQLPAITPPYQHEYHQSQSQSQSQQQQQQQQPSIPRYPAVQLTGNRSQKFQVNTSQLPPHHQQQVTTAAAADIQPVHLRPPASAPPQMNTQVYQGHQQLQRLHQQQQQQQQLYMQTQNMMDINSATMAGWPATPSDIHSMMAAAPHVSASSRHSDNNNNSGSNGSSRFKLRSSLAYRSKSQPPTPLKFKETVDVYETYDKHEYDRSGDQLPKITPELAIMIKRELNEFKMSEMAVHPESQQYTHLLA
ncbi:hypothetical protein GQ42DRAFT_181070 [Ramicandelaber brevisporus]|nr:hypothetical protein GQ42DRAFT_181070 [Ramicandelaber brevisporus]